MGFVALYIPESWHTELKYYAYLFPQIVVSGNDELIKAFLEDFHTDKTSPSISTRGMSVLDYFTLVKRACDKYHIKFGAYPNSERLPSLPEQDFRPVPSELGISYIQLTNNSFLLGWPGPDRQLEQVQSVLSSLLKPYGLIRIKDDFWVKCEYFDFAQYHRKHFNLAKDLDISPDKINIAWPIIEKLLQAKGINEKDLKRFRVVNSDVRFKWYGIFLNPTFLFLLGYCC